MTLASARQNKNVFFLQMLVIAHDVTSYPPRCDGAWRNKPTELTRSRRLSPFPVVLPLGGIVLPHAERALNFAATSLRVVTVPLEQRMNDDMTTRKK